MHPGPCLLGRMSPEGAQAWLHVALSAPATDTWCNMELSNQPAGTPLFNISPSSCSSCAGHCSPSRIQVGLTAGCFLVAEGLAFYKIPVNRGYLWSRSCCSPHQKDIGICCISCSLQEKRREVETVIFQRLEQ